MLHPSTEFHENRLGSNPAKRRTNGLTESNKNNVLGEVNTGAPCRSPGPGERSTGPVQAPRITPTDRKQNPPAEEGGPEMADVTVTMKGFFHTTKPCPYQTGVPFDASALDELSYVQWSYETGSAGTDGSSS